MIEAVDLTKRYTDGTLALDALNFCVEPGEIYCLLGVAGAGKTTALNLFLSFSRPTAGKALVGGLDAAREPNETKRQVAYLTADVSLYDRLTASQNMEFFARLGWRFDLDRSNFAMAMREAGLPERTFDMPVKSFDKGMRQKLGLAAAILKDTPALVLDEPMAGLDAQTAADIVEILRDLRSQGKAILLATHDLFYAKQLADRVGVLKEGRKVLSCARDELLRRDLETLYLDYMRGNVEANGGNGLALGA